MAVGSVGSLAGKIAKMISSDSSKKSILSALRKQGHDSDEILTAYNKASGAVSNPPSVASGLKDKLPAMREATLPTPSPIQAQPQMLKQLGSAPTSSLSKPADISNEASEAIKSGKSLFDTLGKKAALGAGAAGTAIGAGMYLSDDDKQAEEMQGKIDKSTDILNTDTEDDDGEVVPKGPEEWEKTLNGLSRISHTLPDKQQKLWDKKIRDLKTVRDDAINRNEWLSVAETLGQALVQLGAGYHGLRTGRDLSGIQFQKKDWSKNIDQIMDKYRVDASEVDSGRKSAERMTRDRADVIRQKILEKSRGQRSEGSEKRRAEVKAQKDRIKIEENLAKKSEKEIVVLEKKKDAVDQLMVQYDQAGSRKRKKAIQEKIAPALFNLYKGLGVANPMGRVSKEMKAAEESGAWYKPNKFDPEKVNKTAVATPTDSTSSAQAEVDQLEAEIAELERQKGK